MTDRDGMSGNLAPEHFGENESESSGKAGLSKVLGVTEKSPSTSSSLATQQNPMPFDEQSSMSNDEQSSMTIAEAWALSVADISREVNQHILAAYVEPLEVDAGESTAQKIIVRGPSRLICNYVSTQFSGRLRDRLVHYLGDNELSLTFAPYERTDPAGPVRKPATPFIVKRVRAVPSSPQQGNAPQTPPAPSSHSPAAMVEKRVEGNPPAPDSLSGENSNINPRYTFSDFVVGNSNQFCHAAAMRVAEKPGQSYNPLFIYGGVGLGKTHLLHAIGNAVLQRSPQARVLYMSSETFTNELILALRHARMDEFKRKLRAIEVLLIDDIQFISGKERTQEEFFHTFNALYSAKRQIVITSDKIPTDIPGIEERLQTRFSWGLTADLQAPDFETRVAILKQKALLEDFNLPEEVSHLIAERISSNVRELEGALTRLHAVSTLQHVPISMDMARSALKPLLQPKVVNVTVDDIKRAVASRFSLKVSDIISKRRTKNLSFPRHIAMYLCRKHTTASYPEIGEHFGGRDHSSVIHAATVVSTKISTDAQVKLVVEEIEKQLFG